MIVTVLELVEDLPPATYYFQDLWLFHRVDVFEVLELKLEHTADRNTSHTTDITSVKIHHKTDIMLAKTRHKTDIVSANVPHLTDITSAQIHRKTDIMSAKYVT